LNCLTWSVIADLQPSRALLEAGLNCIVQVVDLLDIELEPATCPPSIVARLCKFQCIHKYEFRGLGSVMR
jgi:hypothetical protein